MSSVLGIAGGALLVLTVLAAFGCAALLMYAIFILGSDFMVRYKTTFTESASANMADMFMFMDPARLFYINLVAIVLFPLLFFALTGDPLSSVVLGGFIALAPAMVYRNMRKKRLHKFEAQLPDGLIMVSGAMRAGASLNIALEGLVREMQPPLSQEFELFMREQKIGVDFGKSLEHMEKRLPIQDFSMLASALRINREIGGNLAEIIEALGDTLRKKHQMEGKIQSLTAQGKLQGIVMTGLPILLGVLLYFLEPASMEKLWSTWYGYITLGVIIVMEFVGYIFISKITRIDV